jgi:hypothetical protein
MRAQKPKGSDPWHWRVRNSAHVSDKHCTREILDFSEEEFNVIDTGGEDTGNGSYGKI